MNRMGSQREVDLTKQREAARTKTNFLVQGEAKSRFFSTKGRMPSHRNTDLQNIIKLLLSIQWEGKKESTSSQRGTSSNLGRE